jgi:hypothetical protein
MEDQRPLSHLTALLATAPDYSHSQLLSFHSPTCGNLLRRSHSFRVAVTDCLVAGWQFPITPSLRWHSAASIADNIGTAAIVRGGNRRDRLSQTQVARTTEISSYRSMGDATFPQPSIAPQRFGLHLPKE